MAKKEEPGKKILFSAHMNHNAETVKKMAHMQYNNFIYKRRRIHLLCALAMIALGIVLFGKTWGFISLGFGIFLLWLLDLVPRRVTKQAIKNFNGEYPRIHAFFSETGMFTQLVEEEVAYDTLVKLIEDRNYLYIYVNQITAFMLDKSTVEGGVDELKSFLCEKTGMSWAKPIIL